MASWNVSLNNIGLLARWIGYWYTLLPRDGLVVCLQPCCKFLVLFYQEPAGLNGSQVLYSQTSISLNWLGWSGAGPQNLETLSSGSESTLYCTEWVRARACASCYRIGHCLSTSVYICRSRPLSFRYLEQPPRGQLTGSSDSRGWISCLQTFSSSIITMLCFVTSSWFCLRKCVNWFNQARTVLCWELDYINSIISLDVMYYRMFFKNLLIFSFKF